MTTNAESSVPTTPVLQWPLLTAPASAPVHTSVAVTSPVAVILSSSSVTVALVFVEPCPTTILLALLEECNPGVGRHAISWQLTPLMKSTAALPWPSGLAQICTPATGLGPPTCQLLEVLAAFGRADPLSATMSLASWSKSVYL
eukprot:COSAG04_NODE_119_length_25016_cov_10.947827_2_plen_144_part_00